MSLEIGRAFFWIFAVTLPLSVCSFQTNRNVFETIVETMNNAKPYIDMAKDVANLVSKSLTQKRQQNADEAKTFNRNSEHSFLRNSIVDSFFRMLKLDSSKVVAIAVNSVIFLAQLISTLFDLKTNGVNPSGQPESRETFPKWDPLKYILEHKNERVKRLVQQAQDPELTNQLIRHAEYYELPCVQQLVCKISPIIWSAQKSLKDKSVFKNDKMTSWLPSWNEFESNYDSCEDAHLDCILFPD